MVTADKAWLDISGSGAVPEFGSSGMETVRPFGISLRLIYGHCFPIDI